MYVYYHIWNKNYFIIIKEKTYKVFGLNLETNNIWRYKLKKLTVIVYTLSKKKVLENHNLLKTIPFNK